MDSFYGGKQGIDFVLRGAFSSVESMVEAFKQGPSYTDVFYHEYCIIDTPNKNDKDNGKIYRRGLEYQNAMGGAIYVGQIVGPSSGTPYFQLLSIDDVVKKSTEALDEYQYRRYPYAYDEEAKNVHVRLVGACAGCPMSQLTLTNGVQRYIRETVDKELTVINDNQVSSYF